MIRLAAFGIPLGLLSLILVAAAKLGMLPQGTPLDFLTPANDFIRSWESQLTSSDDPDVLASLVAKNKEGGWVVRTDDGGWVAIVMEHACCTGAGFNATLYIPSTGGGIVDRETCYCGRLPLEGEILTYPQASVGAFMSEVRASKKHLEKL